MRQKDQKLLLLRRLRRQLTNIAKEEIRACLGRGKTDVQTVVLRIKARATSILPQLTPLLLNAELSDIVRGLLKRTPVKAKGASSAERQMELFEMEEFRGITPNITYEDAPGHVAYIAYLDTRELERCAAEKLLANSIAADQLAYLALRAGNEFARSLVALYGDSRLAEIYKRYRNDRQSRSAQ